MHPVSPPICQYITNMFMSLRCSYSYIAVCPFYSFKNGEKSGDNRVIFHVDEGRNCCIDFEYTCHPSITQNKTETHHIYKGEEHVATICKKSYTFKNVQKDRDAGKYTIIAVNKGSAEFELKVKSGKHS